MDFKAFLKPTITKLVITLLLPAVIGIIITLSISGAFARASGVFTSLINSGMAELINNIIILSTALTSVMALTGLGSNHPSSYLRFLSKTVGENITRVTIINFCFLYYVFFVRHFVFTYSGINPQFITVIEWLLICGAFYMGYQNLKAYAETALVIEDVTGTWRKHFQQVETIGDPQLEHLSRLVEGFVDYGLRDDFVTHLTVLLTESGMSLNQVSQINGLLIGHPDTIPPRIGFPWQIDQHKRFNMQRRKKVVDAVLSSIRVSPAVPH